MALLSETEQTRRDLAVRIGQPAVLGGERARMRRALDELVPQQRALLSLRYLEGFAFAELAEVLGVPEGTVKSRLHSARAERQPPRYRTLGESSAS